MQVMHACRRCGAEGITLPAELGTLTVTCKACREEQRVRDYVSDADRLRMAVASMNAAHADHQEKLETGITCARCGGTTPLPADLARRDFACRYCGANMAVSEFVDARVLAAAELRAGMDAMYQQRARTRRRQGIMAVGLLVAVLVGFLVVSLLT